MKKSVCVEAEELTNGDRRAAYGHPIKNFGRTVTMVNAFLSDKLKAPITEEEWGLINVIAKARRRINQELASTIGECMKPAENASEITPK